MCINFSIVRYLREKIGVAGHVIRIDQTGMAKDIFESKAKGRGKVGGPRLRWLEDIANDVRELKSAEVEAKDE
jgi:hypothetical protein